MTILYADDDKEDQELFSEIIHGIDPEIRILFAANGIRVMEVLANGDAPDIIFLDFNMPFLSGYETLVKIRENEKFKESRVIIYSTNVHEQNHEDYAALNAEYLRKPNTLGEAIETLKTVVRSR